MGIFDLMRTAQLRNWAESTTNIEERILAMMERFRLDLSETDARRYLVEMIHECIGAYSDAFKETLHALRTRWLPR